MWMQRVRLLKEITFSPHGVKVTDVKKQVIIVLLESTSKFGTPPPLRSDLHLPESNTYFQVAPTVPITKASSADYSNTTSIEKSTTGGKTGTSSCGVHNQITPEFPARIRNVTL